MIMLKRYACDLMGVLFYETSCVNPPIAYRDGSWLDPDSADPRGPAEVKIHNNR